MGNPTLSLESYAPDVVEEETEEDLEDEINKEEEDCNSIGGLREEGLSSLHVLLCLRRYLVASLVGKRKEMSSAKKNSKVTHKAGLASCLPNPLSIVS